MTYSRLQIKKISYIDIDYGHRIRLKNYSMRRSPTSIFACAIFWLCCCSSAADTQDPNIDMEEAELSETTEGLAQVTKVTAIGQDGQYTFNVTIASPDLGCNQYANWWEVIDIDGNLLYRRILAHSHVNEQPFTRSGGPITITENTEVYIRAHMNTTGYGSTVIKGSVKNGFTPENLDIQFAKDLEEVAPLPTSCAF